MGGGESRTNDGMWTFWGSSLTWWTGLPRKDLPWGSIGGWPVACEPRPMQNAGSITIAWRDSTRTRRGWSGPASANLVGRLERSRCNNTCCEWQGRKMSRKGRSTRRNYGGSCSPVPLVTAKSSTHYDSWSTYLLIFTPTPSYLHFQTNTPYPPSRSPLHIYTSGQDAPSGFERMGLFITLSPDKIDHIIHSWPLSLTTSAHRKCPTPTFQPKRRVPIWKDDTWYMFLN